MRPRVHRPLIRKFGDANIPLMLVPRAGYEYVDAYLSRGEAMFAGVEFANNDVAVRILVCQTDDIDYPWGVFERSLA